MSNNHRRWAKKQPFSFKVDFELIFSSASESGPGDVVHEVMQRGLQIPSRLDHKQDDVHFCSGMDLQKEESSMNVANLSESRRMSG